MLALLSALYQSTVFASDDASSRAVDRGPIPTERDDPHMIAGVGRVDEAPVSDVDTDVRVGVGRVEKDEITRLQARSGGLDTVTDLGIRVTRQRHPNALRVIVDPRDEPGAIEARRRRLSAPLVWDAEILLRLGHDVRP